MATVITDTPNVAENRIVESLFFSGISFDSSKTNLHQKTHHQEFVRDDVLINQSLDPYQRIVDANKIIASGESLFFNEIALNKSK